MRQLKTWVSFGTDVYGEPLPAIIWPRKPTVKKLANAYAEYTLDDIGPVQLQKLNEAA